MPAVLWGAWLARLPPGPLAACGKHRALGLTELMRGGLPLTLSSLTHTHTQTLLCILLFLSFSSCLSHVPPRFALFMIELVLLLPLFVLFLSLILSSFLAFFLVFLFPSHWGATAAVIQFQSLPKGWCQTGAKSQLGSDSVSGTSSAWVRATVGRKGYPGRAVLAFFLSSAVKQRHCIDMKEYSVSSLTNSLLNEENLSLQKTVAFIGRRRGSSLATIKPPKLCGSCLQLQYFAGLRWVSVLSSPGLWVIVLESS